MELGITRLLNAGESALGFVKSINMPLGVAKTVFGFGSAFPYTRRMSQKVLKRVNLALGPLDFTALALDTLELISSLTVPDLQGAKISKLALSVLKQGCDSLTWLQKYRLITLQFSLLRRLEGVSVLSGLTKNSIRLWQEVGPNPPGDNDLMITLPKVLKSSLLICSYVSGDKRVKIIAKGIGLMGEGYSFYKRCKSINSKTWNVTGKQVCQIITSTALAGIAYYVLEKALLPESAI